MDPSERVNANALAHARAFLNQDRPRPSHAEILKKFQIKKVEYLNVPICYKSRIHPSSTQTGGSMQRFKGVLLLASTYLRQVVAAGLLPDPHDVNVRCWSPAACTVPPALSSGARNF